ncbi:thioester reductase domain-containing protein [Streptomyces sp. NPDC101219]|uniref:thioester reductase domain-containing protein n=1 Tax=Streptomyces sp. NPDC101219 TaxID=3366131 RepID=UPI00381ABAD9
MRKTEDQDAVARAEAIEQGGGGPLGIADLLARVAEAEAAQPAEAEPPRDADAAGAPSPAAAAAGPPPPPDADTADAPPRPFEDATGARSPGVAASDVSPSPSVAATPGAPASAAAETEPRSPAAARPNALSTAVAETGVSGSGAPVPDASPSAAASAESPSPAAASPSAPSPAAPVPDVPQSPAAAESDASPSAAAGTEPPSPAAAPPSAPSPAASPDASAKAAAPPNALSPTASSPDAQPPAPSVAPPPSPPAPHTPDGLVAAIAATAGRFLPGGHLAPDADFFDAGGTSVDAVELAAALEDELGVVLDLDEIFSDARPTSLARRCLPAAATGTATDTPTAADDTPAPHTPASEAPAPEPPAPPTPPPAARPAAAQGGPRAGARPEVLDQILADLALADRLPFTADPEPLPPRRLLLTGATGFLGGHMLLDLLRHSDAHVYCLVRAADEQAGLARLGEALAGHRLPWSSEVRRRITVLPGDLRSPRLGLAEETWNRLADELDGIVGVGAAVDFLRGYASLRQSNVLGALTLAELAATGRPKPLHHISSVAVFNEVGIVSMGEDDPLAHVDRLVAGYDQSKWAAEVALRRARDHGLTVTALRPGGIGGHTRTGAYNPQDLSSGLISAFGRFRTVPAFRYLNAAPVDWVSRTAVAVICEPDAWGFDYNLTGVPNTLDDVVRDMAFGGLHVRVQDWDEWRADTLARLEAEPVDGLSFLTRVLSSPSALALCEATLTGPAAGMERTAALVEALDLPRAARYDARAQLRTFERLAEDGLGRLPGKEDPPYLWFTETTEGSVGPAGAPADSPCSMALTLSVASMHQLVSERRVDVRGVVSCPAVHEGPLTVEDGDLWVRPEEGIPQRHGMTHQLIRYRLRLRDPDGGQWWLEGRKHARARRDLWRQTRALTVEIGREGEPARLTGEVVVPADSYVRDQIDGIRVDPRLTDREKRAAKLTWLAWFGLEMGRGLLGPFARAAADLLDLRRTTTLTERHR